MPEKVAELDAKIEAFLTDTQAVRPIVNSAFDPAQYRPERVGIAAPKKPKKTAPGAGTPAPQTSKE